jgi:hypothetical protein
MHEREISLEEVTVNRKCTLRVIINYSMCCSPRPLSFFNLLRRTQPRFRHDLQWLHSMFSSSPYGFSLCRRL